MWLHLLTIKKFYKIGQELYRSLRRRKNELSTLTHSSYLQAGIEDINDNSKSKL